MSLTRSVSWFEKLQLVVTGRNPNALASGPPHTTTRLVKDPTLTVSVLTHDSGNENADQLVMASRRFRGAHAIRGEDFVMDHCGGEALRCRWAVIR